MSNDFKNNLIHLFAGGFSGIGQIITGHPLDTL